MLRWILLASLVFGGCAGPQNITSTAHTPNTASPIVGQCGYTVDFFRVPKLDQGLKPSILQEAALPGTVQDTYIDDYERSSYHAVCTCTPNARPAGITRFQAIESAESRLVQADAKLKTHKFVEDAEGKRLEFIAETGSVLGTVTMIGKQYYLERCTLNISFGFIDERDRHRGDSFLRSAKPVRGAVQRGSVVPTSPDASARLERLREVFTKGLITQAEYDQKRREILDGM